MSASAVKLLEGKKTSAKLDKELSHYSLDSLPDHVIRELEAAVSSPDFDPDKLAYALQRERIDAERARADRIVLWTFVISAVLSVIAGLFLTIPYIFDPITPIFTAPRPWLAILGLTGINAMCSLCPLVIVLFFIYNLFYQAIGNFIEENLEYFAAAILPIAIAVAFIASIHYFYFDGQNFFESNATRSETGIVVETSIDYSTNTPEGKAKVRQEFTYHGDTREFEVWYEDIDPSNFVELSIGDEINVLQDLYGSDEG